MNITEKIQVTAYHSHQKVIDEVVVVGK